MKVCPWYKHKWLATHTLHGVKSVLGMFTDRYLTTGIKQLVQYNRNVLEGYQSAQWSTSIKKTHSIITSTTTATMLHCSPYEINSPYCNLPQWQSQGYRHHQELLVSAALPHVWGSWIQDTKPGDALVCFTHATLSCLFAVGWVLTVNLPWEPPNSQNIWTCLKHKKRHMYLLMHMYGLNKHKQSHNCQVWLWPKNGKPHQPFLWQTLSREMWQKRKISSQGQLISLLDY